MLHRLLRHRFSTSPYQLLQQRNQVYQITALELQDPTFIQQQIKKHKTPSVYCGYDPTSNSLHLGNLLSIIAMGRLATMGLRPIFLIGGATAQIGDPSGKSKERLQLEKDTIYHNIKGITEEIQKVYGNILTKLQDSHKGMNREYKTLNNNDFYQGLNVLEFMNEVGRYFRMGVLLGKENISSRMAHEEGIGYSEFSYSLFQAYDFYRLFTTEKCVLQIGGSDQWGNITNGCDYVKKRAKAEVFGLTLPLLTSANGAKFGKTENNALFLNPQKTPISDVYNYFYSTPDDSVEQYLKFFTFLPEQEIAETVTKHKTQPEKRMAQKLLSEEVITILYGEKEKNHSQQKILRIRKSDLQRLTLPQLEEMVKSVNNFEIKKSELRVIRDFAELMTYLNIKSSKGEVRREIDNGGVYLNNERVEASISTKPLLNLIEASLLHNSFVLVRFGKKNLNCIKIILDD